LAYAREEEHPTKTKKALLKLKSKEKKRAKNPGGSAKDPINEMGTGGGEAP